MKKTKNYFYNFSSLLTLLFANKFFYKLNKIILFQTLRHLGFLNDNYYNYEISGIFNNLKKYRNNIEHVIDIGGHHGDWSYKLLSYFNIKNLYIIEPNKKSFKELEKKFNDKKYNKKVKIYNLFLDVVDKNITLYDTSEEGSTLSTRYKEVLEIKKIKNLKATKIKSTSLDNLIKNEKITKIDLIKIDCEGNEFNILNGSLLTIQNINPKFILFENNFHSLLTGSSILKYKNILTNYKLYRLLPNSMIEIKSGIEIDASINVLSNYLAISNKFMHK